MPFQESLKHTFTALVIINICVLFFFRLFFSILWEQSKDVVTLTYFTSKFSAEDFGLIGLVFLVMFTGEITFLCWPGRLQWRMEIMFGWIQHFNQNAHTCKAMNKTGIWSVVCNRTAYKILHLIGQCGLPQVIHKYILVNLVLIMSHSKLSIRITITFAVFLPVVLDRDGE